MGRACCNWPDEKDGKATANLCCSAAVEEIDVETPSKSPIVGQYQVVSAKLVAETPAMSIKVGLLR